MIPSIDEILAKKKTRVAACAKSYYLFGAYYFSHYFTHEAAEFHKTMASDLHFNGFDFLLWIMFRGSAKTAWAKIKIIHSIVYQSKKNIAWGAYDVKKAEKQVMSMANELQGNKKLINDFGQLYFDDNQVSRKKKKSKTKTFSYFKTENGVLVRSVSIKQPQRGEGVDEFRPDLYVMDDIENNTTVKSLKMTTRIKEFVEEFFGGLAVDAEVLFLANRISKKAAVAWLEEMAKGNESWRVRDFKLEENGKITWPGRYVRTEAEARAINAKIKNKKCHVQSIEKIKRNLGTSLYNQEMLNTPRQIEGAPIKEHWIHRYQKARLKKGKSSGAFYYHFEGDLKPVKGRVMTAIDPAVGLKESSDDRAIVSVACFPRPISTEGGEKVFEKYYMIIKCRAGKWTMSGFGDQLLLEKELSMPSLIGCESNGVQSVFRQIFRQRGISVRALNPKGDKMQRLLEHESDFEFGYILFPDDGSANDLVDETVTFTGEDGRPDNRVDAMVYAIKMHKQSAGAMTFDTF